MEESKETTNAEQYNVIQTSSMPITNETCQEESSNITQGTNMPPNGPMPPMIDPNMMMPPNGPMPPMMDPNMMMPPNGPMPPMMDPNTQPIQNFYINSDQNSHSSKIMALQKILLEVIVILVLIYGLSSIYFSSTLETGKEVVTSTPKIENVSSEEAGKTTEEPFELSEETSSSQNINDAQASVLKTR